MGFWSRLLGVDSYDAAQRALPDPFEPYMATGGIPVMDPGSSLEVWIRGERTGIETFWRTQPNLRKVVDFISRNVAGIPYQLFDRASDTERIRIIDGDLAQLLRTPGNGLSPFHFWRSVVADSLLYDRWCVLLMEGLGGKHLIQVPSWRLHFDVDALRRVTRICYWQGDDSSRDAWVEIDMDSAIYDYGYAPASAGLSPVTTLRDVLDETTEAVQYRREVWANGTRGSEYISRPAGQPWSPEQQTRFVSALRDTYGKDGPRAGGTPLLEDGMEFKSRHGFQPKDVEDLEGRRLTAIEVASAFHIAPELVGAQQGNYSNVREYRQMLYRDSLGPYIQAIEGALNAQLVPRFSDSRNLYVEANIEAKLRGSFEEQAAVMSAAVGAPWMAIDEGRALRNMPPLPDRLGELPVQPLNLIYGGQVPAQAGIQNETPKSALKLKAAPPRHQEKVADVLAAFFRRQGKTVLSAIGSGGEWWDGDRWDRELADDLLKVSHTLAALIGKAEAKRLGFTEDAFDADRTMEFLRTIATSRAATINQTTKAQLDAADAEPVDVFANAEGSRAVGIAAGVSTFIANFGTHEAAEQIAYAEGVKPTKTWVTGPNPRPSHAAMNGETVDLDDMFSNGSKWPADSPDVDEVAGCNCSVEITI